jgi:alanine racemase
MEHQLCVAGYSSRLGIDLNALRANYSTIAQRVAPARCGAVVKANAYGVGVATVAPLLYREGCRAFFVAHLCEAGPLSHVIGPDADIFILNGLPPGSEATCAEAGYIPVLNAQSQVDQWRRFAQSHGTPLAAALQIDSGMSRLGLSPAAAIALAQDSDLSRTLDLRLIMTHLACADEPERPVNATQRACFQAVRDEFPTVPASLANSGGAFLSGDYHFDLARPGIALYGVEPAPDADGLQPLIHLDARILQIRDVDPGTGVGYGLSYIAPAPRRLATLALGYADGWPRSLSGVGAAWHQGVRLPIVGRISMDSLSIDISALPASALAEGDFVELIGPSQSLATVAREAGTIAYELLTRLGQRHARIIMDGDRVSVAPPGENI